MMGLKPKYAPNPNVDYTQILRGRQGSMGYALFGVALGLICYVTIVPACVDGILRLAWLIGSRSVDYADFKADALKYQLVDGLVASQLSIGLLSLIAVGLISYVHLVKPKWFFSVQPGVRVRYLLCLIPVCLLVLNLGIWLPAIGKSIDFQFSDNLVWWILAILVCTPLQAAGEELFFRGYLTQAIGGMGANKWVAVIGSSLVFAFFHGTQNLPLFVDRFGFGVLMGVLVAATGGLEAAIVVHACNNVLSFGYASVMGGVASVRGIQEVTWLVAGRDLLVFGTCALACWGLGKLFNVAVRTPASLTLVST